MILIITDHNDLTTKDVISWLYHFNENYFVIYPEDKIEIVSINEDEYKIIINKTTSIFLCNIKKVWYRRGMLNVLKPNFSENDNVFLQDYCNDYKIDMLGFLIYELNRKKILLGRYGVGNQNKLIFLDTCKRLGISYPKYGICNTKSDLLKFRKKFPKIITKSIGLAFNYHDDKKIYTGYTHLFKKNDISKIPDFFSTSFIQEYVEKLYELRVFYLKGEIYTTAILSQKSKKSIVDFRQGYSDNKMRFCCYKLPEKIENQIRLLMNHLGHEIGSLDLIYSIKKQYIFLELNPIGQFGGNSDDCNYRLEKLIANELRN